MRGLKGLTGRFIELPITCLLAQQSCIYFLARWIYCATGIAFFDPFLGLSFVYKSSKGVLILLIFISCPGKQRQRRRGRRLRLSVRGCDRQEATTAGATALKPKTDYSRWPDEALMNICKTSRIHNPDFGSEVLHLAKKKAPLWGFLIFFEL